MPTTLHSKPLGRFGVEVGGVDLRDELSPKVAGELRSLYADRHLLLFRDQSISVEDQIRFVAVFGPVLDEGGQGTYHGWVSNVRDDAAVRFNSRLPFHSDLGFTPGPYHGISLYAVEVESDDPMPTLFADTVLACRTLPDDLRAELTGREVTNAYSLAKDSYDDRRVRIQDVADDELANYSFGTYPAIDRHPQSGEEYLRVSEMQDRKSTRLNSSHRL